MTAFFAINSFNGIPEAIRRLEQVGAHHRVPLLQAVHHGQIGHLELQRVGGAGLFKRWSAMTRLPAIALIGDDGDQPTGPDGRPIAQRAMRWARQVVLHGTGGEVAHYRAAVAAVQLSRRLLLVERDTATLNAWTEAAVRWAPLAGKLRLETRNAGVHPVPPRRESMH